MSELKLLHLMRLGSFHIASAMMDILVCSVWNRIMIRELGMPAWPVALLLALRYVLAPLALYFGYLSDSRMLFRRYRVSYIWLGRGLMVLALPLLCLSLKAFETHSLNGWFYAVLSFVLYGLGGLISGSPYLALVRESFPAHQQGFAIASVETVLIACFPIWAIIFGLMMEHYTFTRFVELTVLSSIVALLSWFVPLIGVEKSHDRYKRERPAFLNSLKEAWSTPGTRAFFFFLALASLSAWMQDAVLEPFGAEIFSLSVGQSTRLNSVWLTGTLLALLGSAWLFRTLPESAHFSRARAGLIFMSAGMSALALSALAQSLLGLYAALILFGGGFGVYTFSGLNLMSAMTRASWAGVFMGIWTIAQVVSRGIGISLGGILRDLFFLLPLPHSSAYALLFSISAIGLAGATCLLRRVDFGRI